MKKIISSLAIFLSIIFNAHAGGNDIDLPQLYDRLRDNTDSAFNSLCRDIGQGSNFIPMAPPDPYGIAGFDVGVGITLLNINQSAEYWQSATKDSKQPSLLPVPKLMAQKGLPMGFDIGAIFSFVPGSNVRLVAAEARWALMKGSFVKPAIGIRASYSRLFGVPHLDHQTESIDASISKKIAIITPYAGIGQVFTQGKASFDYTEAGTDETISVRLKTSGISDTRAFAGIRLSIFFLKITAEVDFSRILSYNIKLSAGI